MLYDVDPPAIRRTRIEIITFVVRTNGIVKGGNYVPAFYYMNEMIIQCGADLPLSTQEP